MISLCVFVCLFFNHQSLEGAEVPASRARSLASPCSALLSQQKPLSSFPEPESESTFTFVFTPAVQGWPMLEKGRADPGLFLLFVPRRSLSQSSSLCNFVKALSIRTSLNLQSCFWTSGFYYLIMLLTLLRSQKKKKFNEHFWMFDLNMYAALFLDMEIPFLSF